MGEHADYLIESIIEHVTIEDMLGEQLEREWEERRMMFLLLPPGAATHAPARCAICKARNTKEKDRWRRC